MRPLETSRWDRTVLRPPTTCESEANSIASKYHTISRVGTFSAESGFCVEYMSLRCDAKWEFALSEAVVVPVEVIVHCRSNCALEHLHERVDYNAKLMCLSRADRGPLTWKIDQVTSEFVKE